MCGDAPGSKAADEMDPACANVIEKIAQRVAFYRFGYEF
jgi:hypothetical protein